MERSVQNGFLRFAVLRIAPVEMTMDDFVPANVGTPVGMTLCGESHPDRLSWRMEMALAGPNTCDLPGAHQDGLDDGRQLRYIVRVGRATDTSRPAHGWKRII